MSRRSRELCDHRLHDSGLYIQKILTKREMINCQNFNFLLIFINSVTTAVREFNVTIQFSLVTHNAKGRNARDLDEVPSGLAKMPTSVLMVTTNITKLTIFEREPVNFNWVSHWFLFFMIFKVYRPINSQTS